MLSTSFIAAVLVVWAAYSILCTALVRNLKAGIAIGACCTAATCVVGFAWLGVVWMTS